MNTCKTCRWWDLESNVYYRPNVHHCSNEKLEADQGVDPDDCLFPPAPGIFTGPDFGCIHHERGDITFGANVAQMLKDAKDSGIVEIAIPESAEIKNYSAMLDSAADPAQDVGGESVA